MSPTGSTAPPPLRLGYGTNGFANHRLDDALALIAELGYQGVALTLDHHHLDPGAADLARRVDRLAARLAELKLAVVVETGARYLLDPRRKHHPTLVSADSGRRVEFLHSAIRIAADLGAECVSFWSGIRPRDADEHTAGQRLVTGTARVVEEASRLGVPLGFEPEPGMFAERLDDVLALRARLGDPEILGVTLDVGHCVAVEPTDAAHCIHRAGPLLVNVQLDDMLPGVHEHLEFGQGRLDLPATLAALTEVGYRGLAAVELPRHSHAAPEVARRALTALRQALPGSATAWPEQAVRTLQQDPTAIRGLFPAAGRKTGRGPLRPDDPHGLVHGTVDDRARTTLLGGLAAALGITSARFAEELEALYRYGDRAERRGVLRALSALDIPAGQASELVNTGLRLVADALRSNDLQLIAAAMGPFAAAELDDHSWRHGLLKCLFTGVPLDAVAGVAQRRDPELLRMVTDYAAERRAADRAVPDDVHRLLEES